MSAIPKDAADIPTDLPHPTGAATVIDINSVASTPTTTPNPATNSAPSTSTSSSSASSSPSSAANSRLEPRDSPLSSPSPLAPREFSPEANQAEYRAHAYLANESIVATKLAADKFLQNLFSQRNEPDTDILRAASAASRARLQNPFAYNASRSSGSSSSSSSSSGSSSGSSASSSGSSSSSSGSSGSSYPKSSYGPCSSSANASTPHTSSQTPRHPSPATAPQSTSSTSNKSGTSSTPAAPIAPLPAAAHQPLTEADFTDCIKLEDALCTIANTAAPGATAIANGVLIASTTPATPSANTPSKMAVPPPAAAQPNPAKIVAASTPKAASDLVIWQSSHSEISQTAPVKPLRPAPTEAEFRALEEKLSTLSGRPTTIGRTANIHDPKLVASFEENAIYIKNQFQSARKRAEYFDHIIGAGWPAGP